MFDLHKAFSPPETREWAAAGCRSAGIGCLDCKAQLTDHMLERLADIHARRPEFAARPDTVWDVLHDGLEARARGGRRPPWTTSASAMKIRYDDAVSRRRRPSPSDRSPARASSRRSPRTPRGSSLRVFEGPLDLLLYLIRRDKIDIHDIPIAPITRQYMEYLELMQELNLDVAGEFMVMAATLIHIKSKMLVPVDPTEAAGDEEAVDPRDELVQRLLEFQRYKEAAGVLHQKGQIRAATWTRPDTVLPRFDDAGEEMLEAGLFDLISAFKELLERRKTLLRPRGRGARGRASRSGWRSSWRILERGRVAGIPRAVRRRGDQGRDDRHVPGPPGADPVEARQGLPARRLRAHPGVPARGSGRRRAGAGRMSQRGPRREGREEEAENEDAPKARRTTQPGSKAPSPTTSASDDTRRSRARGARGESSRLRRRSARCSRR